MCAYFHVCALEDVHMAPQHCVSVLWCETKIEKVHKLLYICYVSIGVYTLLKASVGM